MAVVLEDGVPYTGSLYVDGAAVGTNPAMTLRAADLGTTPNNWLGRSSYSDGDPLFDGMVDDFRIYRRATTATEVLDLFTRR